MFNPGTMETMTRVGFAARGIMYLTIGFLALRLGRTEDGAGALEHLTGGSAGKLLLAAMAAGFLAYGIWRLTEAAIDSEGHGSGAKGIAVRLGGAVSGIIHFLLSFIALGLATGSGGGSGGGTQGGAAAALGLPGGQLVLALAAAALAATGLLQLVKAYKGDFLRHLKPAAARLEWVSWTGRAGYAARGVVFLLIAWFFLQAALESRASQAGGMGEALSSLPRTAQMVVAAGLLLFGLFSFVEARYRRINDPRVLDRLKAAAAGAA
jgi:hypothetical protein